MGHRRVCGPSLTETSLCGELLYSNTIIITVLM